VRPVTLILDHHALMLRELHADDAKALGQYFDGLTDATTRRFQPHELSAAHAVRLCAEASADTQRFVMLHSEQIIAYFILSRRIPPEDAARYRERGVELDGARDLSFAPSVADAWQDHKVASAAMPHLIAHVRAAGVRSLVLMGGTQATNARAIAFYEKFGFVRGGGYETDVYNHDMRLVLGTE
jgi:diamine N-acetyltransferase